MTGTTLNTLDAALWWPETATQAHSDLNLYLINPSGTIEHTSNDSFSVFEDLESMVTLNQANGFFE